MEIGSGVLNWLAFFGLRSCETRHVEGCREGAVFGQVFNVFDEFDEFFNFVSSLRKSGEDGVGVGHTAFLLEVGDQGTHFVDVRVNSAWFCLSTVLGRGFEGPGPSMP